MIFFRSFFGNAFSRMYDWISSILSFLAASDGSIARIVGLRLACQARLTGTGDVRVDVPPVEDVAARKAAKAERLRSQRPGGSKR